MVVVSNLLLSLCSGTASASLPWTLQQHQPYYQEQRYANPRQKIQPEWINAMNEEDLQAIRVRQVPLAVPAKKAISLFTQWRPFFASQRTRENPGFFYARSEHPARQLRQETRKPGSQPLRWG